MKEKIYTIPINEAYENACECPFCQIEKKLEADCVSYALGAAMMESDYRILSNEKGYCRHHFQMMTKAPNKLSLALVLETHLAQIKKNLDENEKLLKDLQSEKKTIFKKTSSIDTADKLITTIDNIEKSCIICEKVDDTLTRYAEVLIYMWENDENFKNKFNTSPLCMKHSLLLLKAAKKQLNDKNRATFLNIIYEGQNKMLVQMLENLHKFTLKFDYRYKDLELGKAQNAVHDAICAICGYIDDET